MVAALGRVRATVLEYREHTQCKARKDALECCVSFFMVVRAYEISQSLNGYSRMGVGNVGS